MSDISDIVGVAEMGLGVHMGFCYVSVGGVEIVHVGGFRPFRFFLHHSLQLVFVHSFVQASPLFCEGYLSFVVLELRRHI